MVNPDPWHLHQGDALAFLRSLPDSCVELILTDPPYFKVKADWWDRQWEKPEGFLSWMGDLAEQWQRVLRPNGSIFVFASPQMAARVECKIAERFAVLNSIVWQKPGGWAAGSCKSDLRAFFPSSERIVFAEHFGADNMARGESTYAAKCDELRGFVFEPLRAYLDGERERARASFDDVRAAVGCAAGSGLPGHWFTRLQWMLPTSKNYDAMRARFNANGGDFLARPHEDLRREYEDLRREYEDLRRPFAVTADVPYTDVWTFPTVQHYRGKHPCEKPAALLQHMIRSATRPGAVVLDSFAGSCSAGVAALTLGRRFIGSEIDPAWHSKGQEALAAAAAGESAPMPLFARSA